MFAGCQCRRPWVMRYERTNLLRRRRRRDGQGGSRQVRLLCPGVVRSPFFSAGGRIGSSKREQEWGRDAWEKNKRGKTIRSRRCVP